MICEWCGCFFCDDNVSDAYALGPNRKVYCTRGCADGASKARSKARSRGEPVPEPTHRALVALSGQPCPTGNVRYQQKREAGSAGRAWVQSLQGAGLRLSHKLRSYQCPECLDWHYDKSTAFLAPPLRPLGKSRFGHRKRAAAPAEGARIIDGSVGPCADCGKKRFPTKKAALDLRKQRPDAGFRAYRCGDFWHLTTRDAETTERYRSKGDRAQRRTS